MSTDQSSAQRHPVNIQCPSCHVVLNVPTVAVWKGLKWMQDHLDAEHADEGFIAVTDGGDRLYGHADSIEFRPTPTAPDVDPQDFPFGDPSDAFTAITEEFQ